MRLHPAARGGYGETPDLGTLTALLGAGFGGKIWQSHIEQHNTHPTGDDPP